MTIDGIDFLLSRACGWRGSVETPRSAKVMTRKGRECLRFVQSSEDMRRCLKRSVSFTVL